MDVQTVIPHPYFLDNLFAHRNTVCHIFNQVLGLFEINHISINFITPHHELITFSSTPALEFNLFNSGLWRYDGTYHLKWLHSCQNASWQSLYKHGYKEKLYQLKQVKHGYQMGISCSYRKKNHVITYCLASRNDSMRTQQNLATRQFIFNKIAQYCEREVSPLLAYLK